MTFDLKTPSGNSCFAKIDPVVFQSSVLGNLLSNAIKFSIPNEKIDIVILQERSYVFVSVSNIGPEISSKKAQSLFLESKNVSTLGIAGERGTGFGLPQAYKFTKMMDGEIRVQSVKSERDNLFRNTFTVQIPAA